MPECEKKHLILINPKCGGIIIRNIVLPFFKFGLYPPMSLLTLAALTPKDYKIRIFNLKTFWFKKDFSKGALVGITAFTKNIKHAYKLADRYKNAGCYVVMGGAHVSALPDEALEHCHSVIVGEAESVWHTIIDDYENKKLKGKYVGEPVDDWHSLVFDYLHNLTPGQLQKVGIYTSRGCKYNCEYCVVGAKKNLRLANLDKVIKLIEKIKSGIRKPTIEFKDDNIFSSPEHAKELFRRLIPLNIRWYALSSIDIALDDEALELARRSGCRSLHIGFETIYPSKMPKTHYLSNSTDYLKLIEKIKKKKIWVSGSFIMGFDYDTHLDYLKLLVFLARARLFHILLGILTPFPGTAIYYKLLKQGRITSFDWDRYGVFHVVFKPKNLSAFALKSWFIFLRIISFFFAFLTLPIAAGLLYILITRLIPLAKYLFFLMIYQIIQLLLQIFYFYNKSAVTF